MKTSLYKRLWTWIGGRPWTYIWRDIYHTAPYIIQALWLTIGAAIAIQWGWRGAGVFWLIYSFGFLEGHFHWGTKYERGQRGK